MRVLSQEASHPATSQPVRHKAAGFKKMVRPAVKAAGALGGMVGRLRAKLWGSSARSFKPKKVEKLVSGEDSSQCSTTATVSAAFSVSISV